MLFLKPHQKNQMNEGLKELREKDTPPSEKYLMTKTTHERLIQEISRREASLMETLRGSGEASSGGDKWHDELVKNLVDEEIWKRRRLEEARVALNQAEILKAPSQTERIDLGHRVKLRFLNPPEESGEVHVTLLGEQDVIFPDPLFNQQDEIIVSHKSSLGKAILGATKGQLINYSVETRVFRVEIVDIEVSPLVVDEN